jgi:hypothetical protein
LSVLIRVKDLALGLKLALSDCMVSQRFRTKIPLIAIVLENGLHKTRFTEVGDLVAVVRGPLDGVRLVEVQWKKLTALMFTVELREHAELTSETPAPAGESTGGA